MQSDLKIFLAEDNSADVLLMKEALADHQVKYVLNVCKDGAEAASYFNQIDSHSLACPDVILLDLNLPKIGGHELLQRIRAHPVCSTVPVIIVTSSDAASDRDLAARLGATYYFRKPSGLDDFMKLGGIVEKVARSGS